VLRKAEATRRCMYDCQLGYLTTAADAFGFSYNPAASSSFIPPSNATANISTISGQITTGHIANETCTLQAATNTQPFTYNASGTYTCYSQSQPLDTFLYPVVLTDASVTNDLFPPGAFAILGYGVSILDSGLLYAFLPWVHV
jgi:hypothetical protein